MKRRMDDWIDKKWTNGWMDGCAGRQRTAWTNGGSEEMKG